MDCTQASLKENFRKFEEIFLPVELQHKRHICAEENSSLAARYLNNLSYHDCACTSMLEAGGICAD